MFSEDQKNQKLQLEIVLQYLSKAVGVEVTLGTAREALRGVILERDAAVEQLHVRVATDSAHVPLETRIPAHIFVATNAALHMLRGSHIYTKNVAAIQSIDQSVAWLRAQVDRRIADVASAPAPSPVATLLENIERAVNDRSAELERMYTELGDLVDREGPSAYFGATSRVAGSDTPMALVRAVQRRFEYFDKILRELQVIVGLEGGSTGFSDLSGHVRVVMRERGELLSAASNVLGCPATVHGVRDALEDLVAEKRTHASRMKALEEREAQVAERLLDLNTPESEIDASMRELGLDPATVRRTSAEFIAKMFATKSAG